MVHNKYYPAKKYWQHITPLYRFKEMLEGRRNNELET